MAKVRVAHAHPWAIHARVQSLPLGQQLTADDAAIAIGAVHVEEVPGRSTAIASILLLLHRLAFLGSGSGIGRTVGCVLAGWMSRSLPNAHIWEAG